MSGAQEDNVWDLIEEHNNIMIMYQIHSVKQLHLLYFPILLHISIFMFQSKAVKMNMIFNLILTCSTSPSQRYPQRQ